MPTGPPSEATDLVDRRSRTAATIEAGHTDSASIDPGAIMRIKHLPLRAKAVVEGFYNGLHRSPFHGASVEFSEYRPYSVGDDPRGLDWKLYARTDRFFIKRFEDETNRRCYLMLDQSQSMGFGSLEYTKIQYAQTLAATLAWYLTLHRDSVGLMTFDEAAGDFLPARQRPGHLRTLMARLSRPTGGTSTDLIAPLQQLARLIAKRGLVILISDLLVPLESLQINLGYLRSRGHEVMILRTLDPAELELAISSPGIVFDIESGREIYLDPEAAKRDYASAFARHRDELVTICDSLGVDFYSLATSDPLESALAHIIANQQRRQRRGARPVRTASASGGRQ